VRGALIVVLVALTAGCAKEPTSTRLPKPVANHPVTPFVYTDQAGSSVGLEELAGKVWIATFIYVRCPGPCPGMTRAMREIQDKTRDIPDLHFVSFTWDPENDTEEVLRDYARSYRANPERWHFLRGPSAKEVATLQEEGFQMGSPDHHATYFVLVDGRGRVRRWFDARTPDGQARIIADARDLLAGRPLKP